MAGETSVTRQNFQTEVLGSPVPVVVDFWAEWCGPCRAIAPILDQIAQEHRGKLKVVKVNADEQGDLAFQYGVQSLPTLLLFKSGSVVNKHIGAAPKSILDRLYRDHV